MNIGEIIKFNEGIFFNGAVQADWFYSKEKADLVATNYVFHGKKYFGQGEIAREDQHIVDTITFTQELVEKVYDDNEGVNPFTLAIAGYGSGKSHLAVTLAQLLSGTDETCKKSILSNIEKHDSKASSEIASKLKQKNFVLTINGMNDFNLNYEILKCAKRSLDLYGLDDEILLSISSACETAKKFAERYFNKNVEAFENAAEKHHVSFRGEELYQFIQNELGYDDSIYDIVNEVYSDLTGHEIRWDQGISAGKILETLCNEYCVSQGIFNKIIIIFDEFGRYLEYASAYSAKAGDSALQQIFEAAQNTNGLVQFLGFIQSDIKTYLSRVDQSTNISRYISRYDRSDKVHLSSNLETIFANIIERPDKELFNKFISNKILQDSEELYSNIQRWIPNVKTRSAWSNLDSFQRVICEGIYPFHPLTTYLLSSMSDWLQNRSSLVLLDTNIKRFAEYSVDSQIPLIHPVDILDDELFVEILNAEEEGRQRSRIAIIYDNIMKRYAARLNENEIKVLKANLIIKIARFTADSREDLIKLISLCSNLIMPEIDNALQYLEVEYGVLSYDERANSLEFVEDSLGASDFRTFIRRKRNSTNCNYDLLSNSELLDLFSISKPVVTDFGLKNHITTSEWQFEQKLFLITDFTEKTCEKIKTDFVTRYTVDKPKGCLIWLYINKEFGYDEIVRVQEIISNQLDENIPIRIFLLDDSSSDLYNYLVDYTLVSEVTDEEKCKYSLYFEDYVQKLNRNLEDCVQDLKDERKLISKDGLCMEVVPRLKAYLPKVFERLFPKAIPFTFDGFQAKAATITKARKQLISIERFLCSDREDYLAIKTYPTEIQRKFEILLSGNGMMSWKTITTKGTIIPPANAKLEVIYKELLEYMDTQGELNLGKVISKYRRPPYGINDYAISLFLVVFLCINRERIKLVVDEHRLSLQKWSEEVIQDTLINIDEMMRAKVIVVDSLDVRKKYKELFDRIAANTDIAKVDSLEKELLDYLKEEDLPKDLEDSLTLARDIKIKSGKNHKKEYCDILGDMKEAVEIYHQNNNLYKVIEVAEKYQYPSTNMSNGYVWTENQIERIEKYQNHLQQIVNDNYLEWADKALRCREVGAIEGFIKRTKRVALLLESLEFADYARKTRDIIERETANVNAIRERQMVSANIREFLGKSVPTKTTSPVLLSEWKQELDRLRKILDENTSINKYDRDELLNNLRSRELIIDDSLTRIKEQINTVWDLIYEVETNDDLVKALNKIGILLEIELTEDDTEDLLKVQSFIKSYLEVDSTYNQYLENRIEITKIHDYLVEKYESEEADIDISTAIESRFQQLESNLNKKETDWIQRFINCNVAEEELQKWKTDTKELPSYLSDNALKLYEEKRSNIDNQLKQFKVRYIISLINELSDDEWHNLIKLVNR